MLTPRVLRDLSSFPIFRFFTVVSFLSVSIAVYGAGSGITGQAKVAANIIEWQITGDYDGTILTVSGPKGTRTKRFPSIATPSFTLADADNIDGLYQYELRLIPRVDEGVKAVFRAAREAGNNSELARLRKQYLLADGPLLSGAFSIRNGSFVVDDSEHEGGSIAAASTGDVSGATTDTTGFLTLQGYDTYILFDDTTAGSGYPEGDWELRANDVAYGGASYFALKDVASGTIPFTIAQGAPTGSIHVSSGGLLGVGTTTPSTSVHVNVVDTPMLRLEQNASVYVPQIFDLGGNEYGFYIEDHNLGRRPFFIQPGAPSNSIFITSTGRVGMGTPDPIAPFHAKAASGEGVAVFQNGFGYAGFGLDSTGGYLQSGPGTHFSFWAGYNRVLFGNASSGYVGIGTTSPVSKLHVDGGDIRVSGGSFIDDGTTLNVPDYVFESSYQLMPIDDLAAWVRTKKHLPEVPSAAAVQANGLNLGDFQMRLLKKIEELTLYTIEQHERMVAQDEEIRSVRNSSSDEISALRSENAELVRRLELLEKQMQNR